MQDLNKTERATESESVSLSVCVSIKQSGVTVSPVTVFTTPGPVRNMYEVSLIMTVKSVRAGE